MFAMLGSLALAAETPMPSVIHLASEEWEDYTAPDGTGLGWEVLRKVFEPAGVKLDGARVEVPVEYLVHPVVAIGDETVERHRHDSDDP